MFHEYFSIIRVSLVFEEL